MCVCGGGRCWGGGISVKLFYLPSEKGSAVKGKNLLPLGANSFLLEQTIFWKALTDSFVFSLDIDI